jgi:hypothetical protein
MGLLVFFFRKLFNIVVQLKITPLIEHGLHALLAFLYLHHGLPAFLYLHDGLLLIHALLHLLDGLLEGQHPIR